MTWHAADQAIEQLIEVTAVAALRGVVVAASRPAARVMPFLALPIGVTATGPVETLNP